MDLAVDQHTPDRPRETWGLRHRPSPTTGRWTVPIVSDRHPVLSGRMSAEKILGAVCRSKVESSFRSPPTANRIVREHA